MALNPTTDIRPIDIRPLLHETTAGAGAQLALLALLGTATGLGPVGWLSGLTFGIATWAVLTRALRRSWLTSFGAANRVTLARAVLVGGVTALVADSFDSPAPVTVLAALTTVALILDAVDGKVARATGSSSALGARFDMEVDAFLILVLSVYVSKSLGPWVLLIGTMRYAFVGAARFLPWMHAPLPPRTGRKAAAALQGVVLLVVATGLLPYAAALAATAGALGALVWSFGRDVGWSWGERHAYADEGVGNGAVVTPDAASETDSTGRGMTCRAADGPHDAPASTAPGPSVSGYRHGSVHANRSDLLNAMAELAWKG